MSRLVVSAHSDTSDPRASLAHHRGPDMLKYNPQPLPPPISGYFREIRARTSAVQGLCTCFSVEGLFVCSIDVVFLSFFRPPWSFSLVFSLRGRNTRGCWRKWKPLPRKKGDGRVSWCVINQDIYVRDGSRTSVVFSGGSHDIRPGHCRFQQRIGTKLASTYQDDSVGCTRLPEEDHILHPADPEIAYRINDLTLCTSYVD